MREYYTPAVSRYDNMIYRRTGRSGILLPAISLGLWHNFGAIHSFENSRDMIHTAFDIGITHFDLANNYGPDFGAAEETFGRILELDFGVKNGNSRLRDELLISTKAGYDMWPGPYGEWGSRKYMLASCNQSLKRLGLEYVDIFYSHRPDPITPIEETVGALATIVEQGKALYAGISNYSAEQTRKAYKAAKEIGLPLLIHQPNYSLLDRWLEGENGEESLLDALDDFGMGSIVYAPLSHGLLTNKYLKGEIPADSSIGKKMGDPEKDKVTLRNVEKSRELNKIAESRGQSISEMALAWVLRKPQVTSALIGASRPSQIIENVKALENLEFSDTELTKIDQILASA